MGRFVDLRGQRFERLLVMSRYEETATRERFRNAMWLCQCDCGTKKLVAGANLTTGNTLSCGCLHREQFGSRQRRHGMTKSPEWRSWSQMIQRCHNAKNGSYRNYGGRGITVCNEWRGSFGRFFADIGPKPSREHSLERVDNDLGYSPSNCRWASRAEQTRNRRNNNLIEFEGEKLCLLDWAARLGVSRGGIYTRINQGASPQEAISYYKENIKRTGAPMIGSGVVVEFEGQLRGIPEIADMLGTSKQTIYARIKRGQTPEEAVAAVAAKIARSAELHGKP